MRTSKSSKFIRNARGLYVQYAALPIKRTASGELEIMLITSRETRRWVIPKGWPMSGRSGPETASIEAFEEAGIKGRPLREPIGSYRYSKRMGRGADLPCEVTVFPIWIAAQLEDWPERSERESGLFTCAQAAARVDEVELADLILALPGTGN